MHWLSVIFDVDADRAKRFGDALVEAGALSVDVEPVKITEEQAGSFTANSTGGSGQPP